MSRKHKKTPKYPESTIRVLSHDIRVSGTPPRGMKGEALGAYVTGRLELYLNPLTAPDIQGNTVLHELLHAVSDIFPIHLKHRDLYPLAAFFHSLIRDNPELIRRITSGERLI